MAIEEDVSYEDLPADTYATIEESNMMKTDDDAEDVYHGQVDVTPYNNPVPQNAENPYHGEVEVTPYNDPDHPHAEKLYYGNVDVKR